MNRKIAKLASLSPREWLLLPQLVVFSLGIHLVLLAAPLERVAEGLALGARGRRLRRIPFFHLSRDPERLTTLADLATRVTSGRDRCLPRSLLLFWLMRARGEPAELLVGAARAQGTELESHAWIEIRGQLLADSPALTNRYSTFLRL
jgi:hypothetical protein